MRRAANKDDVRFSTESLLPDLGRRSARGGVVTLTAQFVRFALQMGSTAVLARLLEVTDFGLVAMVTAVTGFVALFQDGGLSMATVQRARLTHEQASNLFWVNVLLGLLAMIVTASLAPAVAWVYGRPELVGITLVAASAFLFGGAGVQPLALLRRSMRFRTLAAVDITAMAAGVAVAIALAMRGAGYWALVAMPIATAATKSLAAITLCRWLPSLPSRGSAVRELIGFGQNVIAFDAVNYFARRADNMMIGWQWGAAPLGLYSKAYALLLMPMQQINQPLTSVAVPALSALRSAPERYRNLYRRGLEAASLAGVPIVVLIFVLAPEIVDLVLGERWADAVAVSVTRVLMKVPGLWYCYLDTLVRLRDFFDAVWRSMLAAASAGAALLLVRGATEGQTQVPFVVELAALFSGFGLAYLVFLVAIPGGLSRLVAIRGALRAGPVRPAEARPPR